MSQNVERTWLVPGPVRPWGPSSSWKGHRCGGSRSSGRGERASYWDSASCAPLHQPKRQWLWQQKRETFWTPRMVIWTKDENLCLLQILYIAPSQPAHRSPSTFPTHTPQYPLAQRKHIFLLGLNTGKHAGSHVQKQSQLQRVYILVPPYKWTPNLKTNPLSGCIPYFLF